ncbi:hypothetical protein LX86_006070 [Lentzea aerocolonigenes]|nr:hypothetical protein [Lentzea aerocolonigenes]
MVAVRASLTANAPGGLGDLAAAFGHVAGQIVQDLTELSEAEAAALSLQRREIDLAEVARAAVEAHLRVAGLEVHTRLATDFAISLPW